MGVKPLASLTIGPRDRRGGEFSKEVTIACTGILRGESKSSGKRRLRPEDEGKSSAEGPIDGGVFEFGGDCKLGTVCEAVKLGLVCCAMNGGITGKSGTDFCPRSGVLARSTTAGDEGIRVGGRIDGPVESGLGVLERGISGRGSGSIGNPASGIIVGSSAFLRKLVL